MWDFNRFAGRTAVVCDDGETFSYDELEQKGKALAAAVGSRCLVFNLCSNTIGSLIGYTSFINHNIVPLMLDEHIDHDLLDNFLTLYT